MRYLSLAVILMGLWMIPDARAQNAFWESTQGPYGAWRVDAREGPIKIATGTGGFVLAAVGQDNAAYRSLDNGMSWTELDLSIDPGRSIAVSAVAVDSEGHMLVATRSPFRPLPFPEVYLSSDYGATWRVTNPLATPINSLAVDKEGKLLAVADSVYRSEDRGGSWQVLPGVPLPARAIAAGAGVVVVAGQAELYRSEDGGNTWQKVYHIDDGGWFITLAAAPGGDFYAATTGGLLRSSDGGETWTEVHAGYTYSITALDDASIYAGHSGGLERSDDKGETWSPVPVDSTARAVTELAVTESGRVLAVVEVSSTITYGTALYGSDPPGTNWMRTGVHPARVVDLTQSGKNIIAAAEITSGSLGGVFIRSDAASGWANTRALRTRTLATTHSGLSLMGTEHDNVGLWRSEDGGRTWAAANVGFTGTAVLSIAVSPGGALYAGTNAEGVFRSTDEAGNWRSVGLQNVPVQALLAMEGGDILAGTRGNGLFQSNDAGENWNNVGLQNNSVLALAVDPSGIVLAGTEEAGIFRSVDRVTWEATSLNAEAVYAFAAAANGEIYAGTGAGLYRSADSGSTWQIVETDAEGEAVFALLIDEDGYLYGGTDDGVYRSREVLVVSNEAEVVTQYELSCCTIYPNPFRQHTTLIFELARSGPVSVSVFDVLGRQVGVLMDGYAQAGTNRVYFDGSTLPAGAYFFQVAAGGLTRARQGVLLKE